ncbi:hypothetical protein ACHWQZ_G004452 [Mnemiopsis leidyi]
MVGTCTLLSSSVVIVFLHLAYSVYSKPVQPNIVLVVADDLGYNDVGFRGSNTFVSTPNLDKLANEGVILENHIVSATCSPSRSALMTGRYPIRTGFWKGNLDRDEEFGLGLDETLMPEMLRRNGYRTHGVGKWHLGMYSWDHTPVKRGFETWFGSYLAQQDYFTHKTVDGIDFRDNYENVNGEVVDNVRSDLEGQYSTHLFTNRSVELIQAHDQNEPLFLYLAYTSAHTPHQAPQEDVEKFAANISTNNTDFLKRKKYSTMISIMDDGIGKVVNALNEKGMKENTVLVFTSDNGAGLIGSNYPLRGGKRSFFEGGVRGASFVYSPRLEKTGYTNTNLHHVTDWYATFQKLVGDKPDQHEKPQLEIDGIDIWKSLSEGEPCREEVLYELRDPSKRLDYTGKNARDLARAYPVSLNTSSTTIQLPYDDMKPLKSSNYAQDFFAIRWKNWKLLTGTGLTVHGWSSPTGQADEYEKFSDENGKFHNWTIVSGTFLYNLSVDVREKFNLADDHPDIVKKLLEKRQGYMDIVKIISERNHDKDGVSLVDGVRKPWV